MAKERKSFFEKLTEMNASHEESKKPISHKKKRNIKVWVTLGALALVVTSAITIPLVINTVKVNYKDPRDASDQIIEFVDDKGEKVSISVEELTNSLKTEDLKIKEKNEELYKKVIFYLYEAEQKASAKFQTFWNFSRQIGEAENNNIALKTIDEVRKLQKDKVNDLKRTTQNNYGFENWEKQFKTLLAGEEYGKSSTEEQAIEFLVFKDIQSDALRSFQLENSKDSLFKTKKDINRVASSDIFELDKDGNKVLDANEQPIILVKKGEKVFKEFIKDKNYFEVANSESIITLKTKSFNPQKWSVDTFIDEFLKTNTPYVTSMFTIPGTPPTLLSSPWTVDKDKFTNFALYSIIDNKVVLNGSLVSKFKNIEDYVLDANDQKNKDKAIFENYLQTLSTDPDELKKNLGSTGVTSLTGLFKNDNVSLSMSIVSDLFEANSHKLPEVNLEDLFKISFVGETKTAVDKLDKEIKSLEEKLKTTPTDSKSLNELADKTTELNRIIKTHLSQMKPDEFNLTIGENYRKLFVKNVNNQNLLSFAYNVTGANGIKAVISQAGITLLSNRKVDSKEKFLKLLKADLINLSQGKPDYFKTLNILNASLSNRNSIIELTLKDKSFQEYLKSQVNIYAEEKGANYTDADIVELTNSAVSIQAGELKMASYNALEKAQNWIKGLINTKTSYNFAFKDGQFYIDYNKSKGTTALSARPAKDEILDRILKEFKLK
ncbi:HinT-interacting membrane complex protein P80 [Mycoplasmopsis alligatoris]|uniref:Membrane protein P80 n=1 Tax=Mycoplasmopsis alligatoris A21JP2 TaxID=747682 RepID=D4XWL7_9BACT|nr:hypothetical protein [Mycoplasmopsis alligatoris]EFF41302.1 hypothetical protein MALL_0411 [Mycoplasmopsis alligatoris A21JP2]